MRSPKKLLSSVLLLAMLLTALLPLSSCAQGSDGDGTQSSEEESTTPSNVMNCTVSVSDYFGNAMAGIKASFKQNGTVIKTVSIGDDGAETVTLEKGEYTVSFSKEESPLATQYWNYDFEYDESLCTLTEENNVLSVVLYQKTDGKERFSFVDDENEVSNLASKLTAGAYQVTLASGVNYFVFRPSLPGIYEISYISEATAEIAYHGSPAWSYQEPMQVSTNGVLTMTVDKMYVQDTEESTTPYVISFTSAAEEKTPFLLLFKYVSPPPKDPVSEPWDVYLNPNELSGCTLPSGATLTDFNIFNTELSAVFNESDGYYHLNSKNGPVLYLRLTTKSPYLDDFFTICNLTTMGAYLYDGDGNFLKKERFNELIYQYTGDPDFNGGLVKGAGVIDEVTGVYPLDQYLAYAIRTTGEYMGWWDPSTEHYYLFSEIDPLGSKINENAWLFACCYIAE